MTDGEKRRKRPRVVDRRLDVELDVTSRQPSSVQKSNTRAVEQHRPIGASFSSTRDRQPPVAIETLVPCRDDETDLHVTGGRASDHDVVHHAEVAGHVKSK